MSRSAAVIAWFGTAILAGLVGSWLWSRRDAPPVPGPSAPAAPEREAALVSGEDGDSERAPGLATTGRDPGPATKRAAATPVVVPAPKPHASGAPTPALIPERPAAWIDVAVTSDDPRFAEGDAWLLPAGAPGTLERNELGVVEMDAGKGVLPVPRPGVYDVGYRATAADGFWMRKDVEVRAGERVRVHFTVPPMGEVSFRWENPDPDMRLQVQVEPHPDNAPDSMFYPGRDQQGRREGFGFRLAEGSRTWPIVPGRQMRVRAQAVLPKGGFVPGMGVSVHPQIVRTGDEVVLRVVRLARVVVHVQRADGKPRRYSFLVRLMRNGKIVAGAWAMPKRAQVELWAQPGPAMVTWLGEVIADGQAGPVSLTLGEDTHVDVRISTKDVEDERTWVTVTLPSGRPPPDAQQVDAAWYEPHEGFQDDANHGARVAVYPPIGRTDIWVRSGAHVGVLRNVVTRTTHELRLQLGGFLVLVPETELAPQEEISEEEEAHGSVTLELERLAPIWLFDGEDGVSPRRRVRVQSGARLGPFPPGRHTFVLRRGAVPLGRIEAVVKAGRSVPLVVR